VTLIIMLKICDHIAAGVMVEEKTC